MVVLAGDSSLSFICIMKQHQNLTFRSALQLISLQLVLLMTLALGKPCAIFGNFYLTQTTFLK